MTLQYVLVEALAGGDGVWLSDYNVVDVDQKDQAVLRRQGDQW
jgi:hypothetical protein